MNTPSAAEKTPERTLSSIRRRRLVAALVSVVVTAGFAYLFHVGALPLVPSRAALLDFEWWTVAAYAVIWFAAVMLRSYRWRWLLEPITPVPIARVMAVALVGSGALVLLPLRMGEVVRPAMIRAPKLSVWAATGTVAAERVIDGLVMCLLLFAALMSAHPLEPLPEYIGELRVGVALVPRAAYFALALFAVAFVVMGVFYSARDSARRAILAVFGLASKRFATWLADKIEGVSEGLGFLPRPRFLGPFLTATVLYWLLSASGIWLISRGGGVPVTLPESMVLMGVLALGVLVPNAPGYFGAFQLSLYAGYAMYKAPSLVVERASVVIFMIYLIQTLGTLVLAAASLWWLQREPRAERCAEQASG